MQCAAGSGHSLALSADGKLFAFGLNCYGQLGLGDLKTRWSAEQIIVKQSDEMEKSDAFERKLDQSVEEGVLPRIVL